MGAIFTNIAEIFANSGWAQIFFAEGGWKYAVMIGVACVLLYLAIVHQFEPLLLLPIGFGMLMTNLPLDGIFHMDIFINETQHINWELLGTSGGMADYIYLGVKLGIYPPLIFLHSLNPCVQIFGASFFVKVIPFAVDDDDQRHILHVELP